MVRKWSERDKNIIWTRKTISTEKSIKRIKQLYYYLIEKYPKINIEMICDSHSIGIELEDKVNAQYQYNNERTGRIIFNSNKWQELGNYNMLGRGGIPDEIKMKTWNLKDVYHKNHLQYVFIHEFAHAIETQYKLYENKTIINAYNKYKQNNIFEEDVSEFIVNCFVTSIVAENNEMANRVRKIMEFQIKNN